MSTPEDPATRFLTMHHEPNPLLLPNPWDIGSARLLSWLGFRALATTSSGFAATLGSLDGSVTRTAALEHAEMIVGGVDLPVSADLENGFADDPAEVANTVRDAIGTGLAGCSIEDFSGDDSEPIYPLTLATERIAAAAEAAHNGERKLVLTARAENYLHGRPDLADTITRLQAFQQAGADVLYAPGISGSSEIAAILSSVDRPVNALLHPHGPSVKQLTELGVHRISVGGSFAYAALGALVEAGRDLLAGSTDGLFERVAVGREAVNQAFGLPSIALLKHRA
ncbi:MAG: isocitrate lyase/phosphoenolpyruvate mutase family protein [Nakamurella sp.]